MAWKMYPKYGLTVEELKTKGVIYKITFFTKDGEKYYIGQTNQSLNTRLKNHLVDADRFNNTPIHRAINKYSFENCKIEIIDKSKYRECLNKKEIFWIKYYNSFKDSEDSRGYNCSEGGGGIQGFKHSKESIKSRSGENNIHSKYTNNEIYELKKLLSENKKPSDVSKITGISVDYIYKIKNLTSWIDVGLEFNDLIASFSYKDDNLSEELVEYIKIRLAKGESLKTICLDLDLQNSRVSRIRTLESFTHVREYLNNDILKYVKKPNIIDLDTIYNIKFDLCNGILEKDVSEKYNINKEKIGRIKTLTLYMSKHSQFNEKLKTLNKRVV